MKNADPAAITNAGMVVHFGPIYFDSTLQSERQLAGSADNAFVFRKQIIPHSHSCG